MRPKDFVTHPLRTGCSNNRGLLNILQGQEKWYATAATNNFLLYESTEKGSEEYSLNLKFVPRGLCEC